jgi:hypothetical protein
MLGSLQESNNGFFNKDERIKEYYTVSVRYRKGGKHHFGE